MSFLEKLNEESNKLAESGYKDILDYITEAEDLPEDTAELMKEAFDLNEEEAKVVADFINEAQVKRVSADGTVTKILDRKTRQRKATTTTKLSRLQLKTRAKKAARTLKQTGGTRGKGKKIKKARRMRRARGIK